MPNQSNDDFGAPARTLTLDEKLGITFALFRERALQLRAFHSRAISWPTEAWQLPNLGEPLASGSNDLMQTQVLMRGSVLCHVRLSRGWTEVGLAAPTADALDDAERDLRAALPCPEPADFGGSSLIRLWHHTEYGPDSMARRVAIPEWTEIRANYPPETAAGLEVLMNGWRPSSTGQLLLWHGPPGTGKTYALRALAGSWQDWCEPHYIADPEVFFGQRPDYMLEVLLAGHREDEITAEADDPSDPQRWRLLILEDTGELLTTDAKERGGQGMSRLLNVVDGLIGQGLRVLVLLTGNEPLRHLHPAVSRPGRCASIVEFLPFTEGQASAWLSERGYESDGSAGRTLADLYGVLNGQATHLERVIGFA